MAARGRTEAGTRSETERRSWMYTILVVDDEDSIRALYQAELDP